MIRRSCVNFIGDRYISVELTLGVGDMACLFAGGPKSDQSVKTDLDALPLYIIDEMSCKEKE